MQSKATTVEQYLSELPPDRREALQVVRKVILKNLDKDYEEGMQYGMIGYYVPHRIYPHGYHCDPRQPLPFASLASQKGHMSLYLMGIYGSPSSEQEFKDAWARTGKKLDMGKSCIRFKNVDDLALDVIANAIRRTPAMRHIAEYEKWRPEARSARKVPTAKRGSVTKTATKKASTLKKPKAKASITKKAASRKPRTTR